MTLLEYMVLEARAKAAGIGDNMCLVQILHYLQFQEVATRNFQRYMDEMDTWCRILTKEVEKRIEEAERQ